MTYTLMASTGNMIDWFDNEPEARAALQRIVESDPASADDAPLQQPCRGCPTGLSRRLRLGFEDTAFNGRRTRAGRA